MNNEQEASSAKAAPSKKGPLAVVVIAVAAVIILAAFVLTRGVSEENGPVTGDMSELILQASDIGQDWQIHREFSNETEAGSMRPGAYQMGSIDSRLYNNTGHVTYGIEVMLIFYESVEKAASDYQNLTNDFVTNMPSSYPNPKQVSGVGDDAWVYDIDRITSGYSGKTICFLERNVVCMLRYGSALPDQVTESMIMEVANKQIGKF